MTDQFENLRLKLTQEFVWPQKYMFKFIIAGENVEAKSSLLLLFSSDAVVQEKSSSTGKFNSITIVQKLEDADAVIDIYIKAAGIAGVMSL